MSGSLPGWVGRLAAAALLFAVLGTAYLYVAAPLIVAYRTADEEIERARGLLIRYEAVAATRQGNQRQMDELSSRQVGSGVYLTGETDALASAELQGRVRSAVSAHGGSLRSIQTLPVKSDGEFLRASVRVQFTAPMAAFHRILYALESEKPFVFVDNLDVRNRRAKRRSGLEDFDPLLMIRFDISGYLRPEMS